MVEIISYIEGRVANLVSEAVGYAFRGILLTLNIGTSYVGGESNLWSWVHLHSSVEY